ncbi:MAG: squalene/phytoene synthase family protein [Sphingomonas sp.]|uniref:squalene/phytoene synthase family protein n=1 Tax=Sphingomonas sp. TaxID=28214 RepID=UPI003F80F9CD
MVNGAVTTSGDPWRDLAIGYAPAPARAGLIALFELDAALGNVLRTTREPLIGQMRLAWWREALQRLDVAPPPGEPVLQALAKVALPLGVTGGTLAGMIDGWEPLLGEFGPDAIDAHGHRRGRLLFETAARAIGAADGDPAGEAGTGWALADLSANLADAGHAATVRAHAMAALSRAGTGRWSGNGRALGALGLIARRGLAGTIPPRFVFRLARFRLTGR